MALDTLPNLPDRSFVFIDSNVFIYPALQEEHPMKTIQQLALFILCAATIYSTRTNAQTILQVPQEPKTKIEAFEAQTGLVIICGFSKIGSINTARAGNVSVQSKEFLDASTGKREYGMTIEVKKPGEVATESTYYIDYDEIDSLLKGIDYISKVERSATKLDYFHADYHTKGDFKISTFSADSGETMVAVSSGDYPEVRVFFGLAKLADLRALVANAKAKLDAIQ